MKVLLDTCVWGPARIPIAAAGHDVEWTGDLEADPGDSQILALATREGRVLVTLDKDFGALVVRDRQAHCGLIRLIDIPARLQGPVCVELLKSYAEDLESGAILTVDLDKVRVRLD